MSGSKFLLAITTSCTLLCFATNGAWAQKGGKGGGGGGAGDGDTTTAKYSVLELPGMTGVSGLSDPPDAESDLYVAGRGSEGTSVAAMFARITPAGNITVDYLPEPRVENDPFNGASWAHAVNDAGDVAGSADVLDELSEERIIDHHAMVWFRTEGGYQYIDLDSTFDYATSQANDLNNVAVAVGSADIGGGVMHAMKWDLLAGSAVNLNDLLPADSQWVLTEATQVNDGGAIAGEGLLNGVRRGFVLTLTVNPYTNEQVANVTAVPFPAGGGPKNSVTALTEDGQVTGWADTANGRQAFYWNGTSAQATNLGSLTDGWSIGSGINSAGEVVGESDLNVDESTATFWGTDNAATALESEIPTEPEWLLDYAGDINDDQYVLACGRKRQKGSWIQMGVILVPNS